MTKFENSKSLLKALNHKHITASEFTLDGEDVFTLTYPNGDEEFVTISWSIEEELEGTDPILTRIPKHKLDLKNGNSEIVSDVSQVLDIDLNYPTMLEKIAQLEGLGQYDDDDDFSQIMDEDGDILSPHEVRSQEAQARLTELRKKQFEQQEEKILKARLDEIEDRKKNLAKETIDDKIEEKTDLVSGRGEPAEAK
jgi:hypothetical protein